MRESFDYIMALNKNVQRCYIQMHPGNMCDKKEDVFYVVRSISTRCVQILDFREKSDSEKAKLEGRALDPLKDKFTMLDIVEEAEKRAKNSGIKHFVRSRADEGLYTVEIVSEAEYK
jgi:hypothetical protein